MAQLSQRSALWVIVLGDFGRSPRMQYQCMSLLKEYDVNIHVFAQSNHLQGLIPELVDAKAAGQLQLWQIMQIPPLLKTFPRALQWVCKLALFFFTLVLLMFAATIRAGRPHLMLVQSPPAAPTLAVCALVRYLFGTALIIDFHNVAYTLMRSGPAPGDKSLLYADDPLAVQLAGKQEAYLARFCDSALTVSKTFQSWLRQRWKVHSHVLYDKAPAFFQPATAAEAHELFMTLKTQLLEGYPRPAGFLQSSYSPTSTPVTCVGRANKVTWRQRPRPYVVISSTSWTPDEDFGILLEACVQYDVEVGKNVGAQALPPLVVIITGRGPQQAMYKAKIAARKLTNISFHMAWLSPRQYATALASADLGVSLHTSSSNLDLPMKVSDMLGSGLPVCAMDYPAASEQVAHGETGLLFNTPMQLCEHFKAVFTPDSSAASHPRGHGKQLAAMAKLVKEKREEWHSHWNSVVPAIVDALAPELERAVR